MHIRPEQGCDLVAIREVNCRAFGQDAEARLIDELRAEGYARLSLVAEESGQVVGHILFSELPIHTTDGEVQALSLAPMAVLPEYQRRGIGSALVREGLQRCVKQGHRIAVVLGHTDFYPRFGFSPKLAEPLASPYACEAFMAVELVSGALAGVVGEVRYPPPFERL